MIGGVWPVAAAALVAGVAVPTVSARADGAAAYRKCLACHGLGPRQDDRDGPTLCGVVGRRVAGVGAFAYSPALRAFADRQPRWDRRSLDAFLADPQAQAPGNTMTFFGIRDRAERSALIAWLAAPGRCTRQAPVRKLPRRVPR
jgi:cytochrome c